MLVSLRKEFSHWLLDTKFSIYLNNITAENKTQEISNYIVLCMVDYMLQNSTNYFCLTSKLFLFNAQVKIGVNEREGLDEKKRQKNDI